jgi:hypothetical protein
MKAERDERAQISPEEGQTTDNRRQCGVPHPIWIGPVPDDKSRHAEGRAVALPAAGGADFYRFMDIENSATRGKNVAA